MGLQALNSMLGINIDDLELELNTKAKKLGDAYSGGDIKGKPVYLFSYQDCPIAAQMVQWAKVYAFALEGSAYTTHEISDYDVREEDPYMQIAVYDPDEKMFMAGLRYLPLYKGVVYEKSSMSKLFVPNERLKLFFADALELGATFVVPEIQNSMEAQHYLFSAMAFAIVLNDDAKYLVGRPTIPGTIIDDVKQMISSWMQETFPTSNLIDGERGPLMMYNEIPQPIELKAFSSFADEYNENVMNGDRKYSEGLTIRKKISLINNMVKARGVNFPDIVRFYTKITTDGIGLIVLGPPVRNVDYLTGSWEFPILIRKEYIASIHTIYIEHVKKFM